MVVDRCEKLFWRFVIVVIAMLACAETSFADTLWLSGQQDPIHGIMGAMENGKLQFRKTTDGSTFEQIEVDASSVRLMVKSLDVARLESLMPGDWSDWYEYAEELFAQQKDPVARHLAMRLLVIVLGNSNDATQREAALNDLIELARNDQERRQLQQLRYLETGKRATETNRDAVEELPPLEVRRAAARQVRSVRNGQSNIDPGDKDLQQVVSNFERTCSWQELIRISRSNRIDNRSLRLLVALELELLSSSKDQMPNQKVEWHTLADRVGTSTLSLPTVSTVTEFDPLATKFEEGQWTRR